MCICNDDKFFVFKNEPLEEYQVAFNKHATKIIIVFESWIPIVQMFLIYIMIKKLD